MKLVILISSVLILVAGTAFAPKFSPEQDILGAWKIHNAYLPQFVHHAIENRRKTNPEQATEMEQNLDAVYNMVEQQIYTYSLPNVLELSAANSVQKGMWRLQNNNRQLVITKPNGTERIDSILEISATRLKLLYTATNDTVLFVRP